MESQRPKYFYVSHIFVAHDLLLQKVIAETKVFYDYCSDVVVDQTKLVKGYVTVIVSSDHILNSEAIKAFEKNTSRISDVQMIFSHETIDVNDLGTPYPPTFVYSAYHPLGFSKLSFKLGKGLWFNWKLHRILRKIRGGGYHLTIFHTEMALVIENTTPFQKSDLDILFDFLSAHAKPPLASYTNFPAT